MRASTPSQVPDLPRLLEISCLLHGADAPGIFFRRLEELLPELTGHPGFTWIAPAGPSGASASEGAVLHSTELPGLADRLDPPRLDGATLSQLRGVAFGGELPPVTVEGTRLPVGAVWPLGTGSAALLLLHGDSGHGSSTLVVDALRRTIGHGWSRLRSRLEAEERLETSEAKLAAIGEIGKIGGSLDAEVLLTKLMEIALYIVRGQVGSIVLTDERGGLECPVEWGLPLATALRFEDGGDGPILERVLATGEAYRSASCAGESGDLRVVGVDVQLDGYLCIPLTSQTRTLGAINIVSSNGCQGFSSLDSEVLLAISSIAATSIENAILHRHSLEQERLRQSMALARDIQQRLYPSEPPRLGENLEIAWRTEPCDETGGDYVDFVETPNGLALIVGDVSGHGVGAALLMASARAGLRQALARGVPIAEAVRNLNDQLDRDTDPDQFMTLLVLGWSEDSSTIEYVNAGHDAPGVLRAGADTIEQLPATGIPLGLFPGVEYDTGSCATLAPGDALLLTTDGVWEVTDPQGSILGKAVLLELFRGFADRPAGEIVQGILAAVSEYTGHAPLRDDRTMVVLRSR